MADKSNLQHLTDWEPRPEDALNALPETWKPIARVCGYDPEYYPPLVFQRCHAFGEWTYRYSLNRLLADTFLG